jgi:galactoside O-acetyltransferase
MKNNFFSREELQDIGLKSFGNNVLISRKASIYGEQDISIGDNVRVDDFCILSGKIAIHNYVHIAAYSALFGGIEGIEIFDFANISSRVCIYAINDDYSGATMTNPMVPDKYKDVTHKRVILNKHVIIGSCCTVLPGVTLGEGSSFGAMTLIDKDSDPWCINVGIPFKKLRDRSKMLLEFEKLLWLEKQDNE